jgi:tetratricopeptide (TPR) repeat protein
MKSWTVLLTSCALSLGLASCATVAPMPPTEDLFHDALFKPASAPIDPSAALAMSPEMLLYADTRFRHRIRPPDRRRQLVDTLYRGDLRLEYDAAQTRTAAQAFEARSGNCLALVMMTAAFAKELGMSVRYQVAVGEESWDRSNDLYIAIGHVNLVLQDSDPFSSTKFLQAPLVVDFLPPRDAELLKTRDVSESTVVAMYLNNRAVEALTQGLVDDAYWWAREALRVDRELLGAYVTLGVVYRMHREPLLSEQVLQRVAAREPDNLYAMSNRVLALRDLGRSAEAEVLAQRLTALDPHPPFSYFREGMTALHEGRVQDARRLFAKEVARAPYHHEFEYWLAVSYMELNDADRATIHLKRAMEVSTTRKDHDLYAGKLDRLKALRAQ